MSSEKPDAVSAERTLAGARIINVTRVAGEDGDAERSTSSQQQTPDKSSAGGSDARAYDLPYSSTIQIIPGPASTVQTTVTPTTSSAEDAGTVNVRRVVVVDNHGDAPTAGTRSSSSSSPHETRLPVEVGTGTLQRVEMDENVDDIKAVVVSSTSPELCAPLLHSLGGGEGLATHFSSPQLTQVHRAEPVEIKTRSESVTSTDASVVCEKSEMELHICNVRPSISRGSTDGRSNRIILMSTGSEGQAPGVTSTSSDNVFMVSSASGGSEEPPVFTVEIAGTNDRSSGLITTADTSAKDNGLNATPSHESFRHAKEAAPVSTSPSSEEKRESFTSEVVLLNIVPSGGRDKPASIQITPSLSTGQVHIGNVAVTPSCSVRTAQTVCDDVNNDDNSSTGDVQMKAYYVQGGTRGKRSDTDQGLKEVEFKLDIGKRRLPSPDVRKSQSVEKERAPEFVVKPRRQFVDEGQTAKFKLNFEGIPPPKLSWSRDGKPLQAGSKIKMYEEGGYHYLEVCDVTSKDSGIYVGTIQNAAGTDTASAELDVFEKPKLLSRGTPPPTLSTSLCDMDVVIGDRDVKLQCDITGGGNDCNVTWYHNGKEIRPGRKYRCRFTKGQSASLVITEIDEEDGGVYECVISNPSGEVRTSCTLSTQEGEKFEPPVFIQELQDMEVEDGDKVELIVEVKGSQPIQVYWMHNNRQVTVDTPGCVLRAVDGVHSLTVPKASCLSAGEYVCEAYNEYGDTDTFCRINVREVVQSPSPPEFLTRPKLVTVTEGSSATFTCRVKGHPLPEVTWERNGCKLNTNDKHEVSTEGDNYSLRVLTSRYTDAGHYICHVQNFAGSVSHTCSLVVTPNNNSTATATANNNNSNDTVAAAGGGPVNFRALLKPSRQRAEQPSSAISDRPPTDSEGRRFRDTLRNKRQTSPPSESSSTTATTTNTTSSIPTTASTTFSYTSRRSSRDSRAKSPPPDAHNVPPPPPTTTTTTTTTSSSALARDIDSSSSAVIREGGRIGGVRRNLHLFENRSTSSPDLSIAARTLGGDRRGNDRDAARERSRPRSPPAQETRAVDPVQERPRSPPQETRSFSPAQETKSFSPPEERRSHSAQNRSINPAAQEHRRAFSPELDGRVRTFSPSRDKCSGWGAGRDQTKESGGLQESLRRSPVRDSASRSSPPQDRKQTPVQEYLVSKIKAQASEGVPGLVKDGAYTRNSRESSPFSTRRDVSKPEPSKTEHKNDTAKTDFKPKPLTKDTPKSGFKIESSKSDPKVDGSGKIDFRSVLTKSQNKIDQNGNSKFTSPAESTSKPSWALRKDHPSQERKNGHSKDALKTGDSSKVDFRSVLKKHQASSETKPSATAAVAEGDLTKPTTTNVQFKPRDSRPMLSKAKTWDEDKSCNGLSTHSGNGSKVTRNRLFNKALSKDVSGIKSKFEAPAPASKNANSFKSKFETSAPESKDLTSIKSKFEKPVLEFKSVQLNPIKPQPVDQSSLSVRSDAAAGKFSDRRGTSRPRDAPITAASTASSNTPSVLSDFSVSVTSAAKYSDSSQCSDSAISSTFSKLSEFSDLSDNCSPRSENFPATAAAGVDLEPSRSARRRFERIRDAEENSVVASRSSRSGGGVVDRGGEEEEDEEEEEGLGQAPSIEQRLENQQVTYGGQAVFQCRVVGVPEPDIKWSLNDKAIKQSRFFQLSYAEHVAKLVVAEAFSEDEGEYTCTATNTAGTDSCSCYLIVDASSSQSSRSGSHAFEGPVSIPPRVVTLNPKSLTVRRGEPVRLDVTFTGEPPPSVQWFKAKTEISSDDHFNIMNDSCSSSLTISSTGANDGGRYTITITNDLGTDLQAATINVEDVPEPPVGKPQVYDISKRSVSLSWCGPAYDGGSMVTHYAIEAKDSVTQQWTTLVPDCKSMSYHAVGVMTPDRSYQFRVRAANKLGLSEPSLATESVTMMDPLQCSEDYESDNELPFDPRDVKVTPGRKFEDHYEYLHEVGRGKFGNVYKCKDKATGKIWAAKVLKVREKDKENVRREVEVMNQLAHPKLLMLWDAFEAPRTMVLVMEFVGAGELFERVIRDDFVLTERDCVHFVRQICTGVGYMHTKSILHLDLKPENVLCVADNSNQIKIIDFGLARFFKPGDSLQVLFGTPEFIAPEVVNYDAISYATDMWSIGVICYILLSGLSPFLGDNDAETLSNVTSGEFDFDDESFEDISDKAKDFIQHLLVKRKEKRNTIAQCEKHHWLAQEDQRTDCKRLNTDRLRCFMARRKWQKAGNAFRALGRMASLQKMLTGGGSGSSTPSQSFTSTSSLSSIPDTVNPVAPLSPSPSEDSPFVGGPRSGQATPTPVKATLSHVQSPPASSVQGPALRNGRADPLADSVSSPSIASPSSALKAVEEVTEKEEKKKELESSVAAAATVTARTTGQAELSRNSSQLKGENQFMDGEGKKADRGEDIQRCTASGQSSSPSATRRKAWERDEDTPTTASSSVDRKGLRLELRDTTSVKVSGLKDKEDSSKPALRDRDRATTANNNLSDSCQPWAKPTTNTNNITTNNATNSSSKHRHDLSPPSNAPPLPPSSRLTNGGGKEGDTTDSSAPPPSGLAPPTFVKEMVDCSAFQGDVVRFDVHVTGQPAPQLMWSLEDEELEEDDRIIVELGNDGLCSLIVRNVTEDDEGEYSCRAVNSRGDATCSAELEVYGRRLIG